MGLSLNSNQISDISLLAGLTNIYDLSLRNNQLNYISPLENLTNLEYLNIDENQISDLRPLSSLPLYLLYADLQDIQLDEVTVGKATPLAIYDIDGSRPEIEIIEGTGTYKDGKVTWITPGTNTLTWNNNIDDGFYFSGTATQVVVKIL